MKCYSNSIINYNTNTINNYNNMLILLSTNIN